MPDSPSSDKETPTEDQTKKSADSSESSESAAPEDIKYIKLDPSILQQEFARLDNESEEWRRQFASRVGNAAAVKNKPLIAQYERNEEKLKNDLLRAQVAGMSDEDLEKRNNEDEDFARRLVEAKFAKSNTDEQTRTELAETMVQESVDNAYAFGRANGLNDEAINEIQTKIQTGGYNVPSGNVLESLDLVRSDINQRIIESKISDSPSSANSSLTAAGPDTTNRSKSASSQASIPDTAEEFNKLPREEQRAILATEEGKAEVIKLV